MFWGKKLGEKIFKMSDFILAKGFWVVIL